MISQPVIPSICILNSIPGPCSRTYMLFNKDTGCLCWERDEKKTRMMWGTHISKVRSKSFQDSQFDNMFLFLSLFFSIFDIIHQQAFKHLLPVHLQLFIQTQSHQRWPSEKLINFLSWKIMNRWWKQQVNSQKLPRCSMYGIFAYVWHTFMINVGKYRVHGAYGLCKRTRVNDCYKAQGCENVSYETFEERTKP